MGVRRYSRLGSDEADGGAEHGGGPADLARVVTDELSWFMREHKVTRADLAQAMGVSPGRVSQILSGDENLTLRTLSAAVDALGAELEVVLHPVDGAPQ
jgi:hypothetical protein